MVNYSSEKIQDFIENAEHNADLYYKKAIYLIYPDGIGYHIRLDVFNGEPTSSEEEENSIVSFETLEELMEKCVLYDGRKLSDAVEKDPECKWG